MEEDKNTLDLHTEVREEDRVAKAVALFKEGYNCSQSVVTAFADLYGFTREQALHMSASFGGGIGRMRETCGAACGMFLLAGLEKGAVYLTALFTCQRTVRLLSACINSFLKMD